MTPLHHRMCVFAALLCAAGTVLAQDETSRDVFAGITQYRSTADLSAMKERKIIRALVTPSKTDFFIYEGAPHGLQAELLQTYEAELNRGVSRRELKTRIAFIPVPFNELIPALLDGRGDIAAALLTITPEREKQVHFVSGRRAQIDELLVTHKSVSGITSADDLSGREVYVLRGSSYAEHLSSLNKEMLARKRSPVEIIEADANLLSEDILELVNAGVVGVTVMDDYKARLWAQIFPDVVVREDIKISEGGAVGWAVRRDNPELETNLNSFLPRLQKGSKTGNILLKRYFATTRWIRNPLDDFERKKFEQFMVLFKRYGDEYGFDWLAAVAQAYQESGLDHSVRSDAGAIGIMQVLPSTGEFMGIPDVTDLDANVHAGIKYVAYIRENYFSDPALAESERLAFTWAAYNAGPNKVARMRAKAAEMNLDPNRWFQNVEYAALRVVGQETVQYVSNIYKYYIAYSLSREILGKRADELRATQNAGSD